MKKILSTILFITAFSASAQTIEEAKRSFDIGTTPTIKELELGKSWKCVTQFKDNAEDEEVHTTLKFKKSGKNVKDLNSKNNGFKNYKFKDNLLSSQKRMMIGTKIVNTVKINEGKLITEFKLAGLIGDAIGENSGNKILGYMICE